MSFSLRFSSAARRGRMIATAIACGVLLILSGCIPNLRPAESGAPLPDDFNGKSSLENSAQLTVEEFYQDPVLTGLVAQALAGNQELKILEQEIQLASTNVLRRRGAYLPIIGLRADAGLDRHSLYTPLGAAEEQLTYPGDHHFPDPLPNFLVAADFLWRIDIWREFRNLRDAAAQRYAAAIERRNFFVTQMVAEIANNYFELMALDQRLQILDQVIALQQRSLDTARKNFEAGRGTDLPVQRFQAEVQKNQSEKLIVRQEIVQAENRINFLLGRYPQPVERDSANFLDRSLQALCVGMPADLLLYRTDIRQAERELAAANLSVLAARARFLPQLDITGRVGFEAFNPRYLFDPDALVGNVAGGLVAPLINRAAIQAEYLGANAEQLQAVYNYQRVILNAFTEVVNNLAKAENFGQSVEIKKGQLASLETAVDVANKLFLSARAEYIEVLLAQRDLLEVRTVLVETKLQQLSAIVNAYQALGGGVALSASMLGPDGLVCPPPEFEPGEVPALPIPPAPDNQPAPEESSSQDEPAPDKKPAEEESSSQDEALGRATAADEKTDLAVIPRVDGDLDAEEILAPPVSPPPTLHPEVNDLLNYKYVPAPAVQQEESTPFSAQLGEETSTN